MVSQEFRQRMAERFGATLGGQPGVEEHIGEALNHKAVLKAIDVELYVQGWLRRDAEQSDRNRGRQANAEPGGHPQGDIRARETEAEREERLRILAAQPKRVGKHPPPSGLFSLQGRRVGKPPSALR